MHFVRAGPETGSYDDFMQGAMVVYSNEVEPSIDNSVEFLEHLNRKWGSIGCDNTCFQAGYNEAKSFVYNQEVKNGFKFP